MKPFLCILALILLARAAAAQEVTLVWDAVPEPRLSSYVVYQALREGDHTTSWNRAGEVKAPETTITLSVPDDKNYAWYVTAKTKEGNESQASNMVQRYQNDTPPSPANVRKSEGNKAKPVK